MSNRNALERFARRNPLTSVETLVSLVVLVGAGVVVASVGRPATGFDPSGPAITAVLVTSVLLPALIAVDLFASAIGIARSGFDRDFNGLALAGYLIARGTEACLAVFALGVVGAGVALVATSGSRPKPGGGIVLGFLFATVLVSLALAAVVLVRVCGCTVRDAI